MILRRITISLDRLNADLYLLSLRDLIARYRRHMSDRKQRLDSEEFS